MKLLVISHACIVPVNQQFYAELERETGWEITIIMPSRWASEYGGQLQPKRWPGFQGKIIDLPIFKSGSVPLHGYRSLLISTLKRVNPDAIYVHQEPYSIVAFQIYLANYFSKVLSPAISSNGNLGTQSNACNVFWISWC